MSDLILETIATELKTVAGFCTADEWAQRIVAALKRHRIQLTQLPEPYEAPPDSMSDFPSLAELLAGHLLTPFGRCTCGAGAGVWEIDDDVPWREHVAEAWREACTIRTSEELDGLPEGAIVRGSSEGHAYEKSLKWTMVGRRWWEAGNSSPESSDRILLPALLLWHPDWERA